MKQSKTQPVPPPTNIKRKHKSNIMIDQVLPRTCSPELWLAIKSVPSYEWLCTQRDMMNILMSDSKLFQSFFKRFYLNHLQLHNWYMLARQNQLELKKYVFTHLLSKSYRQYREMVKDEQTRSKFGKRNEVMLKEQQGKDKIKDSFHKIQVGNSRNQSKLSATFGSVCAQQKQRKKQVQFQATLSQFQRQDYHELFLKTFNACDGNKYIYYDFDKHMRGIEQQRHYNTFIRVKKHARIHQSLTLKEEEELTLNKTSEKENSQSTHLTDPHYFHQGEDKLAKMVYCSYNWNPIGSIDNGIEKREQYVLKRLPNVFKKVKPTQTSKGFLLRRKKVL